MKIQNDFDKTMTKSQKEYLEKFNQHYQILHVALTSGGYLSIDYKGGGIIPFKREIRGRKAGFISSYSAQDYDYSENELIDVVEHDRYGKYTKHPRV